MMAKMGWKEGQFWESKEQGITTPLVAKKTDKRGGVIVNTGELSKKVKSVSFNGTPIRTVLLRNMISGATLFYLSLLTSDIWAVVVRTFIYKQKVDWLYYPAFLLVVAGVFLYSKIEKGPERSPAIEDTNFDPEYQHLIGEENSSPVK